MFTNAEKVAIRRFCGFPAYAGFGWVYTDQYATLELRMKTMAEEEEAVVRDTYLANLAILETAILGTSDNLDTDQAAVWTHNKNERQDRDALFDSWRRRLCEYIGVDPGGLLARRNKVTRG